LWAERNPEKAYSSIYKVFWLDGFEKGEISNHPGSYFQKRADAIEAIQAIYEEYGAAEEELPPANKVEFYEDGKLKGAWAVAFKIGLVDF
jgi:hypothetical protein